MNGRPNMVPPKKTAQLMPSSSWPKCSFRATTALSASFPTTVGGEYRIALADPSGVESVEMAVADGPVEYYDLSGRRIAAGSYTPGIYIRRIGTTAEKIIVRRQKRPRAF